MPFLMQQILPKLLNKLKMVNIKNIKNTFSTENNVNDAVIETAFSFKSLPEVANYNQ